MTEDVFPKLIGSSNLDQPFAAYWERKFLFLEKCEIEYSDILTKSDVDFFLSQQSISYPFVRLVKGGKEISLTNYLRKPLDPEFRLIDSDKVLSLYLDGATIILQRAHLWIEKLQSLTDKLQKELRFPVNCNVYITPPQSKGFAPHFDTHDVFILQIAGEKIWNLYNTPTLLPLESESLTNQQSAEYLKTKPANELTLKEGNLLYVPRGLVHDTFTASKQSIHVTLGIFPPRGVDLLKTIFSSASKLEFFKKGLSQSIGGEQKSLAVFSKFLSSEFQGVLKNITEIEIADYVNSSFLGVPVQDNVNRFNDLSLLESVNNETTIYRREQIVCDVSESLNTMELSFYDKTIIFPSYVGESIRFILDHTAFSVQDIRGCLNAEAKLVLVRKLVKEGLLSFARVF